MQRRSVRRAAAARTGADETGAQFSRDGGNESRQNRPLGRTVTNAARIAALSVSSSLCISLPMHRNWRLCPPRWVMVEPAARPRAARRRRNLFQLRRGQPDQVRRPPAMRSPPACAGSCCVARAPPDRSGFGIESVVLHGGMLQRYNNRRWAAALGGQPWRERRSRAGSGQPAGGPAVPVSLTTVLSGKSLERNRPALRGRPDGRRHRFWQYGCAGRFIHVPADEIHRIGRSSRASARVAGGGDEAC